ncbi:uncharacterized protein LOC131659652 [Vicia villosa]|uniref:uncharacterized protein LOC131659652 n=1 Tax=Vicia villosa TaxID=3911 RepID=UPI00273C8816|nr:uncharacterized protein LOC131659652 [Vicia villosa]
MRLIRDLSNYVGAEDIIHVPLVEDVTEDRLVWKEETNGQYSVRSGYRVWKNSKKSHNPENGVEDWNDLWYILAPPRVKHLLWRICKGCLPFRARLSQRQVPCPTNCHFCGLTEEDDRHIFFVCSETNSCWRAAGLFDIVAPLLHRHNDIKSLILYVCSKVDRKVAGLFACMIEMLWQNRNDFIWNNEKEEASRLWWLAFHKWQEWFLAQNSQVNEAAPYQSSLDFASFWLVQVQRRRGF